MTNKTLLAVFLVLVGVCTALHPVTGLDSPVRIVGGVNAQPSDFPYAVSLQLPARKGHFCTGSLLDAKTILTAGHCAVAVQNLGYAASDVVVRVGSLSTTSGGMLANVSSMIAHPDYDNKGIDSDVGILKLTERIPNNSDFEFAVLASKGSDPKAGTTSTVAGWGNTSGSDSNGSKLLQEVDLPIVARKRCDQAYRTAGSQAPEVTKNMICAGYTKNGEFENDKSPCSGDSGGPLVNRGSGAVIGVTSWGPAGCGTDGAPSVFARVGSLRSFIDKYLEVSASKSH